MKQLSDKEYLEYMEEHYIKNNENRFDIMKDLEVSEYQFYKRNKELGISRTAKPNNKVEVKEKPKKKYFDLLWQKWMRR